MWLWYEHLPGFHLNFLFQETSGTYKIFPNYLYKGASVTLMGEYSEGYAANEVQVHEPKKKNNNK